MITEKACTKCGEVKCVDLFPKNKNAPHGVHWQCKACQQANTKAWLATPEGQAKRAAYKRSDKCRAADMAYRNTRVGKEKARARKIRFAKTEHGKRAAIAQAKKYRAKPENIVKEAARRKVSQSVQVGRIPSASSCVCCRCGLQARDYHHFNGYEGDAALQVVPLCKQCHVAYEKIQASMAGAA